MDTKSGQYDGINSEIQKITEELALSRLDDSKISDISDQLYSIYSDNPDYRHAYSSISATLINSQNGSNKPNNSTSPSPSMRDNIEGNIDSLKNDFQNKHSDYGKNKNQLKMFSKYIDHINLEIVRMGYFEDVSKKLEMQDQLSININSRITKLNQEIQETDGKIEQSQGNYLTQVITILSIFAAIVLAFSGGMSFLGNAFQTIMSNKDPIKMVFVFSLFGFIMYNIIIGLLFIVARMNRKDIGIYCKYSYGCQNCHRRPNGIGKILCQALLKYPYITIIDIILILLVYVLFLLWIFPFFSKASLETIWIILLIAPIVILLISVHRINKATKG